MIASFYIVKPEAFEVAKVGKVFSGYQMCEMVKIIRFLSTFNQLTWLI